MGPVLTACTHWITFSRDVGYTTVSPKKTTVSLAGRNEDCVLPGVDARDDAVTVGHDGRICVVRVVVEPAILVGQRAASLQGRTG